MEPQKIVLDVMKIGIRLEENVNHVLVKVSAHNAHHKDVRDVLMDIMPTKLFLIVFHVLMNV